MKDFIKVKFYQLFDKDDNNEIVLEKLNPAVANLCNLKTKNGGLGYDLNIKLMRAVNKAAKDFMEMHDKIVKDGCYIKKIKTLVGTERLEHRKIVPLASFIESEKERITNQINKYRSDKKDPEVITKYEESAIKYINSLSKILDGEELLPGQKEAVIISNGGVELLEWHIATSENDIIDNTEVIRKINELLQNEIELNCYPIKLSRLELEDCSTLDFRLLEDFINDDRELKAVN